MSAEPQNDLRARNQATHSATADISAVVIIKNEELNLPGLIENLRGWVKELVLVDDNSTDKSRQIAEAAGPWVRLVRHGMTQDEGFAGQRNAGIAASTGSWLMHMDCDERVTPELARELVAATADTDRNAFRYRRINYFLHRPMRRGGWNSWNRPQIARRGHHLFEGAIHERCVIEGGEPATGQLSAPMLHLNDEDFEKRLRKSAQYVAMDADRWSGGRVTGWRIFSATVLEFLKKYIAKRGFVDGTPGLIAALHSASSAFRTRALVWDRQNRIPRAELEAEITRKWDQDG